MIKQTTLYLKRFILSPQITVAVIVLTIHLWQLIEADFGQKLIPTTFSSDAGFYHFAAWFNAFISDGGYISDILSISPYRITLTQWYQITGNALYSPFLLNAILSVLSGIILAKLSQLVFDQKTAWVTAILFGFSAQIVFFSGIAGKSILVIFLFSSATYLACLYFTKGQRQPLILATLLALVGSIDRPNVLVILIALFIIILAWANLWPIKKRIIDASLILIIVLSAQSISQWHYGEEPSYYSPVGLNIYLGHSKPSHWSLKIEGIRNNIIGHRLDSVAVAEKQSGLTLTKVEASQYWIQQAIEYANNNPEQYLKTQLQKLFALASPTSIGSPEQLAVNRINQTALRFAFVDFALLYALAGIYFIANLIKTFTTNNKLTNPAIQKPRQVKQMQIALLSIALIGYVASILLTFIVERYRLPLLVFLIPFAAAGLTTLASTQNKKFKLILVSCAVIVFLTSHLSQQGIPHGYGWSEDINRKASKQKKLHKRSVNFYLAASKTLKTPNQKDCQILQISRAKRYYKNDYQQLVNLCLEKIQN